MSRRLDDGGGWRLDWGLCEHWRSPIVNAALPCCGCSTGHDTDWGADRLCVSGGRFVDSWLANRDWRIGMFQAGAGVTAMAAVRCARVGQSPPPITDRDPAFRAEFA